MKILITGGNGLLGKEFSKHNGENFKIKAFSHSDLDVTSKESILGIIKKEKPGVIINCAAIISIDKCEEDQAKCFSVNQGGVKNLVETIAAYDEKIIFVQISSSEVFGRVHDGEYEINGYKEEDEPKPVSNYQKSKTEAEEIVKKAGLPHWYIVRAGWLYGEGRKTFIEQFLEKLKIDGVLEVITDQWRSPTWTKYFVKGVLELIQSNKPNGIYHVTSETHEGEASTMDVVDELRAYLGEEKVRATLKSVSRADIFKVPRAPSNVLKNTKLPKLPYWRDMLREYLRGVNQ